MSQIISNKGLNLAGELMENHQALVIIGLGSQATAWAQNLRDSGRQVHIALRKGSKTLERVKKLSLPYLYLETEELKNFRHFLLLIPDAAHKDFLVSNCSYLSPSSSMYYAHGHSFTAGSFERTYSQFSHLLLAPKAIASEVRHLYQMQGKIGAAYSLEAIKEENLKSARSFLLTLAKDLGITTPFESTFKEETYADLFSEQTILCSLLPYGALHSFNHLVEKGISPEIAYMECWMEVKLIANAMVNLGPMEFFKLISPNALIGGEKAQALIFNKEYQTILEKLSKDIWSEKFFTECEKIDSNKLRTEVLTRWSNEKLTKTYEKIGKDLTS